MVVRPRRSIHRSVVVRSLQSTLPSDGWDPRVASGRGPLWSVVLTLGRWRLAVVVVVVVVVVALVAALILSSSRPVVTGEVVVAAREAARSAVFVVAASNLAPRRELVVVGEPGNDGSCVR